jgi:SAM-dependent methyltransferase
LASIEKARLGDIYRQRFAELTQQERESLWRVLCEHFLQRYIPDDATVLDLAAGRCEFINQIRCASKIAVDLNPDIRHYAGPDVRVVIAYSHDMADVASDSVDVVFVSNFFEHLPDKQVFLDTLREIRRVLRPGGKLLIFQPNIRFLNGAYWDFIDHYLPLTDRTLVEALHLVGLRIDEVRPRFLPYTTRSRLPRWPWLVRLYLQLRPAHWIFGRQAFVAARKESSG